MIQRIQDALIRALGGVTANEALCRELDSWHTGMELGFTRGYDAGAEGRDQ